MLVKQAISHCRSEGPPALWFDLVANPLDQLCTFIYRLGRWRCHLQGQSKEQNCIKTGKVDPVLSKSEIHMTEMTINEEDHNGYRHFTFQHCFAWWSSVIIGTETGRQGGTHHQFLDCAAPLLPFGSRALDSFIWQIVFQLCKAHQHKEHALVSPT